MPEDLVSVSGIAKMLGVTKQRADQLSREKGFPEPAADLDTGGRVFRGWRREDVAAWAASKGRS
jgi:hypothetical protein